MSERHQIDVYFHNHWGSDIQDVTLKFNTSKSDVKEDTYTKASVAAGEKWGPLQRTYETGPDSEDFDFWYVEFASPAAPSGQPHRLVAQWRRPGLLYRISRHRRWTAGRSRLLGHPQKQSGR